MTERQLWPGLEGVMKRGVFQAGPVFTYHCVEGMEWVNGAKTIHETDTMA